MLMSSKPSVSYSNGVNNTLEIMCATYNRFFELSHGVRTTLKVKNNEFYVNATKSIPDSVENKTIYTPKQFTE